MQKQTTDIRLERPLSVCFVIVNITGLQIGIANETI